LPSASRDSRSALLSFRSSKNPYRLFLSLLCPLFWRVLSHGPPKVPLPPPCISPFPVSCLSLYEKSFPYLHTCWLPFMKGWNVGDFFCSFHRFSYPTRVKGAVFFPSALILGRPGSFPPPLLLWLWWVPRFLPTSPCFT